MKTHKLSTGPTGFGWARSLLAFRHQSRAARLLSTLVALATAALVVLVGTGTPAVAASPCPIPGSFEIDGDMTKATCDPAGDDWNTAGLGVQSTTQGGTYSTAGKDDGNPSTWVSSGSTPNKTDFERAYAMSRVVGGHFYVDVAWERTDTSGTQGYAIEIDNSGVNVGADGTPQPNRSNGTAVVYISSQGSSAPTFDSACTFTTQSDYGQTCSSAANPNVVSAINTASISDPIAGTTQAAGSFFEVSIDVTGLTGIAPSCPGPSAASVYLRSITGQTHNGNLKGYMAPLSVAPDSTCVAPPIETTATPGGAQVAPGTAQHDDVTVGTAETPAIGSVKFFLCQPNQVTAGGCEGTAGTQVGSAVTLDGNGQGSSAAVTGATAPSDTATGKYCWRAEFTPGANDHHYLAGNHTNATTECFTVVHASPTITTQIAVTGAGSPGLGFTTLGDTATLHGFVPGTVTGETIDFNLYDVTANPGCTGTVVFHTTGTLNGSGVATTSSTYDPIAAHKYTWIASYGGNAFNDGITGTCADANESATIVGAQIDVSKSANPPGPVSAGSDIGFDLTVSNAGDVPAKGVHVTDNLPAGADGVSGGDLTWSLDPAYTGCSISGAVGSQVLSCDLGQVDGGASLPAIHVTSSTAPVDCGVVKNKASVSTTNGTGGDSDVASVTVLCPGLNITKTADAASVTVGSPIGFTVTVSNNGQGTASGVNLSDPLPTGPGITWTIDTDPLKTHGPLTCSIASGTLHCTGSLDAGATQVVHVTSPTEWTGSGETEVNSCLGGTEGSGVYDNTAQVSATNVTGSPTASAQEAVLCPDLHVTKVADAASVDAGSQIGFVITASNTGDAPATGAFVDDPLPTGVTWSIPSGGSTGPLSCQVSNGSLTCSGTLPADASQVVHITAPTEYADCGVYDNTATFTATDSAQAPNASDSTSVLCPSLTLAKTADAASVDAGGQIGFTVTASNKAGEGVGNAKAVTINDPLPAGSGVDWSIASGASNCSIQGAPPAETLVCSAVDLAPGASESVHVVSGTTTASCLAYPNTASLTATNHPSLTASATTTVANCVIVSPPSPPKHHPSVLPNTGGPDRWVLPAGLVLLLAGTTLVVGDRRRRRRS